MFCIQTVETFSSQNYSTINGYFRDLLKQKLHILIVTSKDKPNITNKNIKTMVSIHFSVEQVSVVKFYACS